MQALVDRLSASTRDRLRDTREAFDENALLALRRHTWRGNVRELENVVERAVVMSEEPVLGLGDLPVEIQEAHGLGPGIPSIPGSTLAEIERFVLTETLDLVGGSRTKAAKMLGISVRKVQYRLQEYGDTKRLRASSTDAPPSE